MNYCWPWGSSQGWLALANGKWLYILKPAGDLWGHCLKIYNILMWRRLMSVPVCWDIDVVMFWLVFSIHPYLEYMHRSMALPFQLSHCPSFEGDIWRRSEKNNNKETQKAGKHSKQLASSRLRINSRKSSIKGEKKNWHPVSLNMHIMTELHVLTFWAP